MAIVNISSPFEDQELKALKIGDIVSVSGKVITARDRAHAHLLSIGESPIPLNDVAIYHCGPIMLKQDNHWKVIAAGPTTSARQNKFTPDLIKKYGVKVIIGKGGMDQLVRKACKEYSCVYLQLVGGAAAGIANSILNVENVYFLKEFGMAEAMWELTVEHLEAVVAIDTKGRSIHEKVEKASKKILNEIL